MAFHIGRRAVGCRSTGPLEDTLTASATIKKHGREKDKQQRAANDIHRSFVMREQSGSFVVATSRDIALGCWAAASMSSSQLSGKK